MEKLRFAGYHGCDSICGIQEIGNNEYLLTELGENNGTSITNACEIIATYIATTCNVEPSELRLMEYYPDTPMSLSRPNLEVSEPHYVCGHTVIFRCRGWEPISENETNRILSRIAL